MLDTQSLFSHLIIIPTAILFIAIAIALVSALYLITSIIRSNASTMPPSSLSGSVAQSSQDKCDPTTCGGGTFSSTSTFISRKKKGPAMATIWE